MARKRKLHDDWLRLGREGVDYGIEYATGNKLRIVMFADGGQISRNRTYTLDGVYSKLIQRAHARGLANKPLVDLS